MKKNAVFWIIFSGVLWFIVGIFLLLIGVKFIVFSCLEIDSHSLMYRVLSFTKNREQSALILVGSGLVLGFVKARFVLSKTVQRVVVRIRNLPEPIGFFQVYSLGYLVLIASMILMGMGLRWFSVPSDIRGVIDVAVGSALLNGSMFYFKAILKTANNVTD
jgi:hypothetical protein